MDNLQTLWNKIQNTEFSNDKKIESLEFNLLYLKKKEKNRQFIAIILMPFCLLILGVFIYLTLSSGNLSNGITFKQVFGLFLVLAALIFLFQQFRKTLIKTDHIDLSQPSKILLSDVRSKLVYRRKSIVLGTLVYLLFLIPGIYLLLQPYLVSVMRDSMLGLLCGSMLGIGGYTIKLQRSYFDKHYGEILNRIDSFLGN